MWKHYVSGEGNVAMKMLPKLQSSDWWILKSCEKVRHELNSIYIDWIAIYKSFKQKENKKITEMNAQAGKSERFA